MSVLPPAGSEVEKLAAGPGGRDKAVLAELLLAWHQD